MTVRELGHLVLYVRDLGRSVAFYRDVLGWEQVLPAPGEAPVGAAGFSSGRTHHELPPHRSRTGRHTHPIRAARRPLPLRAQRGRDRRRPAAALDAVQKAGATVVGSADHTVTHSLYILDPDGNEIELYVDVPGVDWRSNPTLVGAAVRPLRL